MIIQYRDVKDFCEVVFRGPGQLEIVQAESDSLCIEAAGSHLDQIESRVAAGRLILGLQKKDIVDLSAYHAKITFRLGVHELKRLKVSGRAKVILPDIDRDEFYLRAAGSTDVTLQRLTADNLNVNIADSAVVQISGDVEHQTVELSGNAKLNALNLVSDHASMRLMGRSSAEIRVNDELNSYVGEAARLTYMGYPDVEKYGAGVLTRRRKQISKTRETEHG